jgi:hypothetical protein
MVAPAACAQQFATSVKHAPPPAPPAPEMQSGSGHTVFEQAVAVVVTHVEQAGVQPPAQAPPAA